MTAAVAIIGMACRYPDARTPEELWQTVLARRRAFRRLPEERLRLKDYFAAYDADPDSVYPIEAAVLEDYTFDRARFRIPASAVSSADLTHWLALDVATDALADAGLRADGALARDNTAVIVGNTLTGEFSRAGLLRGRWPYVRRQLDAALADEGFEASRRSSFLQRFEDAYKAPFPPPDEETLAGGLSNTIAGRICNYYDLHGGGYTVDGACASSLLAVAHACRLLESREVDTVLAGGVDLSLDPLELVGFARIGALSKSVMRVFDKRADGFWPGEGCGFVVLKRADDAAAGHHRVRAFIRGWGISSDGAGGLTRPTISGQRTAVERAYRHAGFGPGSVPLFEAHGTGTAVGDPIEVAAIAEARRSAGVEVPAVVGSIKANIGHTKAAAGLAGLIKTVLALEQRVLPAATACQEIHPAILDQRDAVTVPQDSRVWPEAWPLRAGVSAFGFGGINVHLALEGAGRQPRGVFDAAERRLVSSEQDAELFLFAADDRESLRHQVAHFAALAPRLSRAELADAAAALTGRLGAVRAMTVAATPAELADRLDLMLDRLDQDFIDPQTGYGVGTARLSARIAFVFPGQAAPVRPNGGQWARRFPWLESIYQSAKLPEAFDPTATEIAQPAIMTNCLAGLAALAHFGVEARVAVGHSVGELAALHWAGAFDADALLRLAHGRGKAMAKSSLPGGAMGLIAGTAEETEELLQGADAVIACHNGASEFVVSGDAADVAQIVARASARGLSAQKLPVSHAFHSRFTAPAEQAIRDLASTEIFASLQRTVISTVTGAALDAETDIVELLAHQVAAPVRFAEALALVARRADLFIEVGPGHGMTRIVATRDGPPCVALDAGGESFIGLLSAIGAAFVLGASIRASALFSDRFVRDFDLDRPRRFLANPCESAPADAVPPSRSRPKPELASNPISAHPPGRTALDVLREQLAHRLELDAALIEPHHRLLSDLHLNSIAVGQIVGETARVLGRAPPVTPLNFAAATVGEAAAALEALAPPAGDGPESFPAGVDSWIRCFTTQYQERARPTQSLEVPRNWQVFAPKDDAVAKALSCLPQRGDQPAESVAICLSECQTIEDQGRLLAATHGALAARAGTLLFLLYVRGGGAAFARCVSLEHPKLRVLVVELPRAHPDAAAWIAAEIACAAPGYQHVRYEMTGRRFVPVLLPILDLAPSEVFSALGADDVVLVSGGAKGIGAECALALVRGTGAKLALLGRSPADAPEVTASIARLRAAGITVGYQTADVTDRSAVVAAVVQLESALGPVTGVLHAAGVNKPTPVARLDGPTLDETMKVKVAGLGNLLSAVAPERLRLLVGFSSIIARIGLPGEAHYALANEWMGRLIERFAESHPACRTFVPEWSVWSGVGMGETLGVVETLARQGVAALAAESAAQVFASLATARDAPASIVVASRFGDPPTVDLARPALPSFRFLDRILVFYPGIELVAEAALGPNTDPYLDEHALAGTKLFPAVLGLEAMFQAAFVLAKARPDTLERVNFYRPLAAVDDAVKLRIAALRTQDNRVEVVLRSNHTGFQAEHFRAVATVGQGHVPSMEKVGTTILKLSADEIYDRLLFHRGRFRRVVGFASLSATACVAHIRPDPEACWFPTHLEDVLLLGDPGIRDAAIHALQACIPHRRVLPVAVERIRLGYLAADRNYTVHAREVLRDKDRFVFDVDIRENDGSLAEHWQGLELRAIEPIPDAAVLPTALARPFLERRLGELLPSAGLRINIAAQDCREQRVTDTLLGDLVGPKDVLQRRSDGRPEAKEGASASHAGNLTFVVAANGPVGCDIEPIVERSATAWRDLLGSERFELAGLIAKEGDEDFSAAATRVWGALEALKKAGSAIDQAPLSLERVDAGWVLLRSGQIDVATWAGNLDNVRVAVATATVVAQSRLAAPAYSYRHVVGFGDTNLIGNVYYVNYLAWQGRCREMFLRDKAPTVLNDLANGLSLVTTRCSCDYLSELMAFDEVRLDMRLKAVAENRVAFAFEYWRCNRGREELVASGEQEIACLRTVAGRMGPCEVPVELRAALRKYV